MGVSFDKPKPVLFGPDLLSCHPSSESLGLSAVLAESQHSFDDSVENMRISRDNEREIERGSVRNVDADFSLGQNGLCQANAIVDPLPNVKVTPSSSDRCDGH